MAYSATTYRGDGSQSTFMIPFDYLQKDFVKVTINEVDKVYAQDYNVDGRELSFPTAPPSGSIIKVYRETPTDRMVKWNEGSVLTSSNMTTQQIQELHLIEETTYNLEKSAMVKTEDNHKWEGQYLPITHVGDPTDDSDVVNLGTIKKEETGFIASVRSQLDRWLADLGVTYNSYSKSLKESFDSYASSLKNQFDTHTASLLSDFNDYKDTLKTNYDNYTSTLLNNFNDYKTTLKNQFDTHTASLLSDFNDYKDTYANYTSTLLNNFNDYKTTLKNTYDTYTSNLSTTFNGYKTTLLNNFNDYKTTLKNTYDTYTSNLSTTFNGYKTTLLNKYNEYLDALTATKDAVKDSEANANKYKDEAKNFSDSAKDSATQCAASVATCTTRVTEANQAKESASASANTATTKATESGNSASLAKKWAVSAESPDGAVGSKSAKTWAEEAKSSEQKATTSANNAKGSEDKAKASEVNAKASETASANSATASAKSATAAKGSEDKAKASEVNAKASETASANSATASAKSATAAKGSEDKAKASEVNAKKWAVSAESPDGAVGSKSAKTWAEEAKSSEQKATTSANNAKGSEDKAKASEVNAKASETASANSATASAKSATAAKGSEDKAKASEVNAKASEVAAAESAKQASAGQINADWNETNADSKAYIKNKPAVMAYKRPVTNGLETVSPSQWEDNSIQSIANAFPDDHPNAYPYGVKVTLGKIKHQEGNIRIYFPHNGGMYLKNYWNGNSNSSGWITMLNDQNFSKYAVSKSALASSVSTNTLTAADATFTDAMFTGQTYVPTANEGNSSNTIASTEFVTKSLAKMVDSAPESLNTLNELAKALGDDPNFATTVLNELGKKMNEKDATDTFATKTEAENTYAKKGEAGVLSGTVTAFSGTFEDGYPIDKNTGLADKKWHLCDGTNGTPDLRNRFIYGGAGNNNGGTGGEVTHTLTINELPRFTPTAKISKRTGDDSYYMLHDNNSIIAAGTNQYASVVSSPFNAIGNNQPHNNMPPYYVLAYIMKL